jgi:molybdopterin synthase sulfur carrier subunit
MARVRIPSLLRPLCDDQREVIVGGATLGDVLRAVDERYPGFFARVVDAERNRVFPDLAIAIDGEAGLFGLHEPVGPDADISIVPAIGGG